MRLLKEENSPVDLYGDFHRSAAEYLYDKLGIQTDDVEELNILEILDKNLANFFTYLEQEKYPDVRIKIRIMVHRASARLLTRERIYGYVSGKDIEDMPVNFGYQYFEWYDHRMLVTNKI